jgi:hypothetical protein
VTEQTGPGTLGNRDAASLIADLVPQGRADVSGVILCARPMSIGGAPACRYTISDGTGELDLLFLGRVEIAGLRRGRSCRAMGTVGKRDGRLVLWNPRYWLASASPEPPRSSWPGASDYLSKPFTMDAHLTRIR